MYVMGSKTGSSKKQIFNKQKKFLLLTALKINSSKNIFSFFYERLAVQYFLKRYDMSKFHFLPAEPDC